MSNAKRKIDVVLEGPAANGRISVDYLASLAKELQSTLRRLAANRPVGSGRFTRTVEEACRLELVHFSTGSVHLDFELAGDPEPDLFGDAGEESLDRLVTVLESGTAGDPTWDTGLPVTVLEGLDRMTRPLCDGITAIHFKTFGPRPRSVTLRQDFRSRIQTAAAKPRVPTAVRLTGVIWEADWRNHTAELHVVDGRVVRVKFDAERDEDVTEARRRRVAITGVAKLQDGGEVREITLDHLEILDQAPVEAPQPAGAFWSPSSIEELARIQQVRATTSPDDLAGDWPEEDSLDEFLASVQEARR